MGWVAEGGMGWVDEGCCFQVPALRLWGTVTIIRKGGPGVGGVDNLCLFRLRALR